MNFQNTNKELKVVISVGDESGIGPEIILKALCSNEIPDNIDYDIFSGLSNEIKSKLKTVRPKTLGQALRIDGVTPAAAIILFGYIKTQKKRASA